MPPHRTPRRPQPLPEVPEGYFYQVRKIVNDVDPMGLIDMGAPADEYDPEVGDLVALGEDVSADRVQAIFDRWFGPGDVRPESVARIVTNMRKL